MSLPELSVKRPITTVMILVSVLVIGGIALARLPLAYLPDVDVPFIFISIPYPDSNPTQVEKEITKPVEEILATQSGVKTMKASSTADGAQFNLQFKWGQNLDVVRMQVSEKMDQIKPSLPAGVGQIQLFSFNTSDIPVIQARISAKGVNLSENYDLIEARVLNRIRRVPGVGRVDLDGVAPREINIDLILDKVKEHRVDINKLIQRLQGSATNMVLGPVDNDGLRYTARVVGSFASVDELRNFAINENGLKLSDIADVKYEQPVIKYGRHLNREYAIALTVYKESTANTVDVVNSVMKVIRDDIGKDPLLNGVEVFSWDNQADQITAGLDGLKKAGAVGAFLAIFILYYFLRRFDSTIIVSLSIPFSVVAACGVMYFMGKSLNLLSMMGLMLGIGMLVDNAIVVLEAIDRTHRTEEDTQKAALEGARQVGMAVTASTLTTVIVFLPLIVGASSELTTWLREVGVTISLALACSLFSSLTLIPLMSAHFLRRRKTEPSRFLAWLEEKYGSVLSWTLNHKIKTFGLLALAMGAGFAPLFLHMVKMSQFSGTVNKFVRIYCEFDDFHYKSDSEKVIDKLENYLFAHKKEFDIASVYSYYGENEAQSTITLDRLDLNDDQIKDLREKIRAHLPVVPGVRFNFSGEDTDQGGDSTFFAVKFFGQDSEILRGLAEEAERRLGTLSGVKDLTTTFKNARKEIQVSIDKDKAARVGLTPQDVSRIFGFTLGGLRLRRFNAGEREVETWLQLQPEDRTNLEDLKRIQFLGEGGAPIQLADIASFHIVNREEEIRRENRKVTAAVSATYEGKNWTETQKQITDLMNAMNMPPGYVWSWNDRILEQQQENAQMGVNFLLALVLVYLVMASLFESILQPVAILCSILFALPGAFWLLAVTRTPFNLMAQIGLLILMGIVVNNGIVLLDRVNQLRREGLPRNLAIVQAGRDRMRPILMTASTTVIGLLPLAIGGSVVGGLFYYPMARTVMGGLISSAFFTLLVLPYINVGVEAFGRWFRTIWMASSPRLSGPAPEPAGAVPVPTHPSP